MTVSFQPKASSRPQSMAILFGIFALAIGISSFLQMYSAELYDRVVINPFSVTYPLLITPISIMGVTPLELLTYLVCPASAFFALYVLGDRLSLDGGVLALGSSLLLAGPVGYLAGYAVGLVTFFSASSLSS